MTTQRLHAVTEAPSRLPWRALLLLSGAAFATVTVELLPASLLLEISRDLRVAPASAGVLVSAWALTIVVASVPLTRLTTRVPRRRLVPAALLLLAAGTVATALAPSYGWVVAGRVTSAAAHGLFWSLLVPTAATLVAPERTGRAVSVVLAGPTLAGVVGIPLAATAGAALGWRSSFALLGLLLGLAALAVRTLPLPDPSRPQTGQEGRDPALPRVLGVAVAGGLVLTGHFLLYTYIAPLLQDFGGYDSGARGLLLFVFGAAGMIGLAGAGGLSDRFPRQALGWVGIAFAAGAAGLLLIGLHLAVAVLMVGLWGVLIGLLPPVFQTHLLRVASPGRENAAGAIAVTMLNLGVAAGATLGGAVLGIWRPGTLPVAATVVIAVAAAGLAIGGRRAAARPRESGTDGSRGTGQGTARAAESDRVAFD